MNRKLVLILLAALMFLPWLPPASASTLYFANEPLPQAMAGVYYSARVKVVGDNVPYVITLTTNPSGDNEFPSELSITPDGVIYGTPKNPGVYPFSLQMAYDTDTTTFCVTKLVVRPFSEEALRAGGENVNIIGSGLDSLTGVANGTNGGRAAMDPEGDTVFFIDSKYRLRSSIPPYTRTMEEYPAPEYRWLDSLGSNLYYYHRYLGTAPPAITHVPARPYVTRIARDPIGRKGRATVVELSKKDIRDLAVTEEIVLYILGKDKGSLVRAPLTGGKPTTMRIYAGGSEVIPDMAFPYNGYAYVRNSWDKALYRAALDGQLAHRLTTAKVQAFTVSSPDGDDTLFFADSKGALHRAALDGSDAEPLEGLKASALNSDADTLFFASPAKKNRLFSVPSDGSGEARPLTEFGVDQIYVFEEMLVVQKKGTRELYILSKDGEDSPVRLVK